MISNPEDLEKISLFTLEHYNQYAEEFWKGTRNHNVCQNIEALLQHIEGKPPFTILDFGCGPLEAWHRYASAAGFIELTHYYRPDGAPREQQPWLASVWRRLAP